MQKFLVWGSVLLGILFIVVSYVYVSTPANALPAMMPGYDATLATVHYKHALAAFLLGLASFAYAWFASGPKK